MSVGYPRGEGAVDQQCLRPSAGMLLPFVLSFIDPFTVFSCRFTAFFHCLSMSHTPVATAFSLSSMSLSPSLSLLWRTDTVLFCTGGLSAATATKATTSTMWCDNCLPLK